MLSKFNCNNSGLENCSFHIHKAMKDKHVKRVTKICVRKSTTNIHSKCKVTCKNVDFECRYIRTYTKEKPPKMSNITFAILPFYQKKHLN